MEFVVSLLCQCPFVESVRFTDIVEQTFCLKQPLLFISQIFAFPIQTFVLIDVIEFAFVGRDKLKVEKSITVLSHLLVVVLSEWIYLRCVSVDYVVFKISFCFESFARYSEYCINLYHLSLLACLDLGCKMYPHHASRVTDEVFQ